MKAGTFNINEYLDKLHENVNEEDLTLNEEKEGGSLPDSEGFILPKENRKAYDWLKREFQKGKTEVKVEMSYYTFKPGYEFENAPKSTKAFPGMYGDVKHDTTNKPESTAAPFPETKFPGMGDEDNSQGNSDSKTKTSFDNKTNNKSEFSEEEDDKTQNGIKVEAKTKEDCIEEEKAKKKKKKESVEENDEKKKDKIEESLEAVNEDYLSNEALSFISDVRKLVNEKGNFNFLDNPGEREEWHVSTIAGKHIRDQINGHEYHLFWVLGNPIYTAIRITRDEKYLKDIHGSTPEESADEIVRALNKIVNKHGINFEALK